METLSLLGILAALSAFDIRTRSIPISWLLMGGIAGLVMHLGFGRIGILNILGGIAVGIGMYFFSIFSGGEVGKGDAILLGMTGIYLGLWSNLLLLWLASVLAGAYGLLQMLFNGKSGSYELPFVPFVLVAYVGCLAAWGGRLL